MALETTRRSVITGLIALVAAPAIVRVANLMPVKQMRPVFDASEITFTACGGPMRGMSVYAGNAFYWLSGEGLIVSPEGGDITIDIPSVPIRRDAVLA